MAYIVSVQREEVLGQHFIALRDRAAKKIFSRIIFGGAHVARARENNKRDCKWAIIMIANTEKMAMIDKKTGICYKVDGHDLTWEQNKEYSLVRWANGFDL